MEILANTVCGELRPAGSKLMVDPAREGRGGWRGKKKKFENGRRGCRGGEEDRMVEI